MIKSEKEDNGRFNISVLVPASLFVGYIFLVRTISSDWPKDYTTFHDCSYIVPLAGSLIYLLTIFLGRKYMKSRSPIPLINFMISYNAYQILLNGWTVYSFIRELVLNNYPIWGNTLESTNYSMSFLIWIHYNNKYLEFFDTFIMVARKSDRQVTFLHVYHHILLVWAWWAVCHFACGGDAYFGAMVNSFVHIIMYGYYLMSVVEIPCPWKKYITQVQLVQFVLCFGSALYCLIIGTYPFYLCVLQIYVMTNMLVLFIKFYWETYFTSPKKKVQ